MTEQTPGPSGWAFTVPGLRLQDAQAIGRILQARLEVLNEFTLTLQHARWNVVGPQCLSVRTMLLDQLGAARGMVDEIAERIAALGRSPNGLPGALVAHREWSDYELDRHDAMEHLRALSLTLTRVTAGHRAAISDVLADPVTAALLTTQAACLEQCLRLIRAHFEDAAGGLDW